jgi:hypothetical protein
VEDVAGGVQQSPIDEPQANMAWNRQCEIYLVDLLSAMSRALGNHFTTEELKRGVYYPKAKVELEQAQLGVLHGARAMLEGKTQLQMRVVEFPSDPTIAKAQAALLQNMSKSYTENGELRVRISDEGRGPDNPS